MKKKTILRQKIDIAFYDIRPGNGTGLFLQPRNPHVAALAYICTNKEILSEANKRATDARTRTVTNNQASDVV